MLSIADSRPFPIEPSAESSDWTKFRSASHCCKRSGAELRHVMPLSDPKLMSKNSARASSGFDRKSFIIVIKKEFRFWPNLLAMCSGRVGINQLALLLYLPLSACFLNFPCRISLERNIAPQSRSLALQGSKKPSRFGLTHRIMLCSKDPDESQDFSRLNQWAEARGIVRSGWDIAFIPAYQMRGLVPELVRASSRSE